jgi:hypothetical protein
MEEDGREADEMWKLGTGIIERLGGRGGIELGLLPDVENVGEKGGWGKPSSKPASDL